MLYSSDLRRYTYVLLSVLAIYECKAQPSAKGLCFGANGMVYIRGTTTRSISSNNLEILFRPELSYMFTDRFSVGLRTGIDHSSQYYGKKYYGYNNLYTLELFSRKLIPVSDGRAGFVLSHSLGKAWSSYHYNSGGGSFEAYWQYAFTPSFYYMITKSSAFELQFGMVYIKKMLEPSDYFQLIYGVNVDKTSFQVGYKYYLNRKNKTVDH